MFCCPVSLGLSRDDRLMQQKSSVCLWQSAIITSPREPNNKREREREKKEKHDFLLLPLFVFIAGSRKKRVIEWEKERIFSWPKCPTVCIVVCVLVLSTRNGVRFIVIRCSWIFFFLLRLLDDDDGRWKWKEQNAIRAECVSDCTSYFSLFWMWQRQHKGRCNCRSLFGSQMYVTID